MRALFSALIIIGALLIINLLFGLKGIYNNATTFDWLFTSVLGITTDVSHGPPIPAKGRHLIISNHPSFVDGFVLMQWAIRQGIMHRIRFIVAEWVGKIPLPGIGKEHFIKVKRQWAEDKDALANAIGALPDDAIVFIFPEGTTFCPGSLQKTVDYARKHELPIFRYLMCPRIRGLELLLKVGNWSSVYDMTIHYPERAANPFWGSDFEYILWGNYPRKCKIEWRQLKHVPPIGSDIQKWLLHLWERKDLRVRLALRVL
jgi:1-acyl-sn-glycerol-3-phosphate acyltransferase